MALHLDPQICRNLEPAARREWLVTDGLGGYASGTVAGVNTRRYHGLLVASLKPPVQRMVLLPGERRHRRHASHLPLGG
jgi:hypothetical protein